MLVLEIRLNGELKATCGAEDIEDLVGSLSASRKGALAPKTSNLVWIAMVFGPLTPQLASY
jgi:hypothetical protein